MDDHVLLSKVLEDATMLQPPEMVCLHKGTLHLGPGAEYLECARCGGRWRAKVAGLPERKKEDVVLLYRNWEGKVRGRLVRPKRMFFGSNEWHKEPQWLLEALDLEKNETRFFAMSGIITWQHGAPQ